MSRAPPPTDPMLALIDLALRRLEAQGKVIRVTHPDGTPVLDEEGEQLWTLAPQARP